MYKYKARIIKTKEIIAKAQTIEDLESEVRIYKRNNKEIGNQTIEVLHYKRDKEKVGVGKIEVVKII